jgi:predicted naringenin-chalcone synthase
MTLGARIPELIREHLRPWLEAWLREHGHTLESIAAWAVHPGGPRVVSAVEKALDLPEEATGVSREILSRYGNMSSPTILFILNQLRRDDQHLPCVALGFGPGLVAEAAIFV